MLRVSGRHVRSFLEIEKAEVSFERLVDLAGPLVSLDEHTGSRRQYSV